MPLGGGGNLAQHPSEWVHGISSLKARTGLKWSGMIFVSSAWTETFGVGNSLY